jgi:o-succinylbenzoate---CoA ligase
MGAAALTWKSLKAQTWFFSPNLEAWQKKILTDLKRRVPRAKDSLWILSSGTQSVKSVKAVGLTWKAVLTSSAAVNRHLQSVKSDRWLAAIPAYHIGGLSIYARASLTGARVFEIKKKWHPSAFVKAVAVDKITLTSLVPTQLHDLVAANLRSPESLRAAVIGGGALDPSLYLRARDLGWPVLPSYGLTECCSQVATASLASLGTHRYPEFQILDHIKIELREQRIFLRSESLCPLIAVGRADGSYTLEDPRREGWLGTADTAEWVSGQLKLLGRRDDVVKVLGVLVPLQEVEQRARETFGWGERFFIAARPDARAENRLVLMTDSAKSLREWQNKIGQYNGKASGPFRIQGLCWVPSIRTNEMGKLSKAVIIHGLFG